MAGQIGQMSTEDFFNKLDERLDAKIEEKIGPVRTTVQSLTTTVNSHTEEIKNMKNDIQSMKAGSGNSISASSQSSDRFVASKLIIKNFSEYHHRHDHGIDRSQAEILMTTLMARVPEGLKDKVYPDRMTLGRASKSDRIHVPVKPGFAEAVAGAFYAGLHDYTYNNHKCGHRWDAIRRLRADFPLSARPPISSRTAF